MERTRVKRFSVRDFIAYNNPCFSCGSKINFNVGIEDVGPKSRYMYAPLRPLITPERMEIDITITYKSKLTLRVEHKTNKISTNNAGGLVKYFNAHNLYLISLCPRCNTEIQSHTLITDMQMGILKSTTIDYERLIVNDGNNFYRLDTFYDEDKSRFTALRGDGLDPINLELPLMPKSRFKNREKFIEKCNLMILFS